MRKIVPGSTPWQIAFEHQGNGLGCLIVVEPHREGRSRCQRNPQLTPRLLPAIHGSIVRIKVGQNPRGIVINKNDAGLR
jgi:hypothetical protein